MPFAGGRQFRGREVPVDVRPRLLLDEPRKFVSLNQVDAVRDDIGSGLSPRVTGHKVLLKNCSADESASLRMLRKLLRTY